MVALVLAKSFEQVFPDGFQCQGASHLKASTGSLRQAQRPKGTASAGIRPPGRGLTEGKHPRAGVTDIMGLLS
jgi:hypothetical protein